MGVPLTILSSAEGGDRARLVKTFTPEGVQSYPLVRNLNSHHYETEATAAGLRERYRLLKENARYGHAMLKGQLKRPLQNESRSGLTDGNALTQTLLLDIDQWPLQGAVTLQQVAETIVASHKVFENTSYIAHASSSFGLRPSSASVHIEFTLSAPVSPRLLKVWLRSLNIEIEAVRSRLRLTANSFQLKWVIDPSVADNSKLIYIGAPTFNGVNDPFANPDERWALIEKERPTLNLMDELVDLDRAKVDSEERKRINALRKIAGMEGTREKTVDIRTAADTSVTVITNPGQCMVQLARLTDEYAVFNINGGDSNGYWCYLRQPDIIYNFKGERPFLWSRADPESYEAFIAEHADKIDQVNPYSVLAFRDAPTDRYFVGLYDRSHDRFGVDAAGNRQLNVVAKSNLDDAIASFGDAPPEIYPTMTLHFDPRSDLVYDKSRALINRFELPELLKVDSDAVPEEYQGLRYEMDSLGEMGLAAYFEAACPNIHKIIFHALGEDLVCFEHFINWLAFCAQERKPTSTAWVLSGIEGTGKGLMMTKVIKPIWERYAAIKVQKNLEDGFNGGMDELLMVAVDEVHSGSSKNQNSLIDTLKHIIGSEITTIRSMRTDQREARLHCNFMIFSNHLDAMKIDANDRRFNVSPPQGQKIINKYPELIDDLSVVDKELPAFSTMLLTFQYDEKAARTCLDNSAKRSMRKHAETSNEQFFAAIRRGDLDYFIDYIMFADVEADPSDMAHAMRIRNAQRVVKEWIKDTGANVSTAVSFENLRVVYNALNPKADMPQTKFMSAASKNGLHLPGRIPDKNGNMVRGGEVMFKSLEFAETMLELASVVDDDKKEVFDAAKVVQLSRGK